MADPGAHPAIGGPVDAQGRVPDEASDGAAQRAAIPTSGGLAAIVSGHPTAARVPPAELDRLHPALWRGHQLGAQSMSGCASGFPDLDAQLPGGGWPRRALTELLLGHMGIGELRLLAPALSQVQQAGRLVMLFDPPAVLSGWALAEMGLDVAQLLLIQSATQVQVDPRAGPARAVGAPARLWALEQALKSGHVGAVLAWLPPRLSPDRVRRLQLAAQAHDGPAFMLRESAAQSQPSAAPLRLALRPAGVDQLAVNVLKRRGPPLLQPLHLRLPTRVPAAAARRGAPVNPAMPVHAGAGAPVPGAEGAMQRQGQGQGQALPHGQGLPQTHGSTPGLGAVPTLTADRLSAAVPTATFINLA